MVRIQPLTVLDFARLEAFESSLRGVDGTNSGVAHDGKGWITRGSVQTFERSGHAFVAVAGQGPDAAIVGFVLASTIWDGHRPTVRCSALVVDERDSVADAVRAALLEALTKSAYDAAVYDLVIELPSSDEASLALAASAGWMRDDLIVLRRTLGSRGG